MNKRDLYEVLGVTKGADDAALKAAFRKKAMEHHPDRNAGDPEAESRFKEVNEAYSILSDSQKRAAYDRYGFEGVNGGPAGGGAGFGGAGFGGFEDIFSAVFGEDVFGGRRGPMGPSRGNDMRYDAEISLEQAYAGAEIELSVPTTMTCTSCKGSGAKDGSKPTTCRTCGGHGQVRSSNGFFSVTRTCPSCQGQGEEILDKCKSCQGHGQVRTTKSLKVKIPPGVDDGTRIILRGEGQAGPKGGPKGDLYVILGLAPHEIFERDGLDLHCAVPVPMGTAVLGGVIEVPCLTGGTNCDGEHRLEVIVPEGAQTGHKVRLKAKGMPELNGKRKGDLIVELFVETPRALNAQQKELMRQFVAASEEKAYAETQGFLNKAKKFWDNLTSTA
jgi:molecular chaperone DnaJ